MARGTTGTALAALAIAGLAFSCTSPTPRSGGPSSFDDALASASERGTPLLLDFFTEW